MKDTDLLLLLAENEYLVTLANNPPIVLIFDNHRAHIYEHKEILKDSRYRDDPEITQRVLDHIQEHIKALKIATKMFS